MGRLKAALDRRTNMKWKSENIELGSIKFCRYEFVGKGVIGVMGVVVFN